MDDRAQFVSDGVIRHMGKPDKRSASKSSATLRVLLGGTPLCSEHSVSRGRSFDGNTAVGEAVTPSQKLRCF